MSFADFQKEIDYLTSKDNEDSAYNYLEKLKLVIADHITKDAID